MIIWYAGYLDVSNTHNPIVLRGVDSAGNLIREVRVNNIDPTVFSNTTDRDQILFGSGTDYRFVNGFNSKGEARILANRETSPENYGDSLGVYKFAVSKNGRIYCAMTKTNAVKLKPGVTPEQLLAFTGTNSLGWSANYYQDYIETGNSETYHEPYVDFFRVYREGGDRVNFPTVHARPVRAVAIDDDYLYIAGEPIPHAIDGVYLRKLTLDGTEVWTADLDATTAFPAYYSEGSLGSVPSYTTTNHNFNILLLGTDVYISGYRITVISNSAYPLTKYTEGFVRKYNSAGALQWEFLLSQGKEISNIVTDGTNLFVAFFHAIQYEIGATAYYFNAEHTPVNIVVLNQSGAIVDTHATPFTTIVYNQGTPQEITGFSPDNYPIKRISYNNGKIYAVIPAYYTGDKPVFILDSSTFAEQTPIPSEATYLAAADPYDSYCKLIFDSSNNQYFASKGRVDSQSPYIFNTFDSAGNRLWLTKSIGSTWTVRNVYLVTDPSIQSLRIPLNIRAPTTVGDRYTIIPALRLAINVATPFARREYVGQPLPSVYKAILKGPSSTIEIEPLLISIRMDQINKSVSVISGLPSLDVLTEIEALIDVGDLIVYGGVAFFDGSEQLEELARVKFQKITSYFGSSSASITVGGVEQLGNVNIIDRAVKGISYRSLQNGLRRVRCELDLYLTIGSIADLGGGESMVVGEMTITVTPENAAMEILEAAS